jgi:AcrR family transcriptional regulator
VTPAAAPAPSTEQRTPARAGRHRSEVVDRVILDAALGLLREHGYEALTMLGVIERSGVSSASLYRRWRTKQALVVAALESLTVDAFPCNTGTLAGDLGAFAQRTAKVLAENGPLLARLTSELNGSEDVLATLRARLLEPRLEELEGVLQRARSRGELLHRPPPAEEVFSLLTGPLHHRSLVLGQPLRRAFVRAAVDQTVAFLSSNDAHGSGGR